jgi:cobalt-precorrin 5A hydrolase
MKKAAILAFGRNGRALARTIERCLAFNGYTCRTFVPEKYADADCTPIEGGIGGLTCTLMQSMDALIFVGACGIAVRAAAPHIKSKMTDPAILCADERGTFVISLLSGHIGGGNRLAGLLAAGIGAMPVITTATDVEGRFSVDAWASENGYQISSMGAAKRISAAILEREIPVCADAPIIGPLPPGLCTGGGTLGICISARTEKPFADTLFLIPKVLKLGIGCRRNTPCSCIEEAVNRVLSTNGLFSAAVKEAASVTLKENEAGLLEFCAKHGIPVTFYTAEELMSLEGVYSASEFVLSTTGADNVSERSAVMGSHRLIVPKTAVNGVTVAVAETDWEVRFG